MYSINCSGNALAVQHRTIKDEYQKLEATLRLQLQSLVNVARTESLGEIAGMVYELNALREKRNPDRLALLASRVQSAKRYH